MLTLLPKGVQTKYLKLSDRRFFPFATGVVHRELRIELCEFSDKKRNGPNGMKKPVGGYRQLMPRNRELEWFLVV